MLVYRSEPAVDGEPGVIVVSRNGVGVTRAFAVWASGTTTAWAADDPVLPAGEWGVDWTTGAKKKGDGTSRWSQLPVATLGSWSDLYGAPYDLPVCGGA